MYDYRIIEYWKFKSSRVYIEREWYNAWQNPPFLFPISANSICLICSLKYTLSKIKKLRQIRLSLIANFRQKTRLRVYPKNVSLKISSDDETLYMHDRKTERKKNMQMKIVSDI